MNIAVIMTTYFPDSEVGQRRLANAKRVVESLHKLLRPRPLLVIADDSGEGHRAAYELLDQWQRWLSVDGAVVQGLNLGVGASLNRALSYLDGLWGADPWAWLYLPDDFLLTRPLDLAQAVALLDESHPYWYVRLDLPHPNLLCSTRFQVGIGWWIEMRYEAGGFVFATRPTLISRYLHMALGPFREKADSYEVERDYSQRVQASGHLGALVTSPPLGTAWEHLSTDEDEVGRLTPWQHPAVR